MQDPTPNRTIPNAGLKALGVLLLLSAPPILLLIYIKLFGVDVVFSDEWDFVPLIEKMFAGTLTLGDLYSPHNHHRMLFPRIIMLALARPTHFNTVAAMFLSWGLLTAESFMILHMFRQDFGASVPSLLKFAPVAWMIFNFRQFESILWGLVGLQVYVCTFGFVASIYLLTKAGRPAFFGAVCAAVVSTFSFANGLLVWPVGLLFIIMARPRRDILPICLWAVTGAVVWAMYLHDLPSLSGQSNVLLAVTRPIPLLTFFVLNIGASLAYMKSAAGGMGAAILVYAVAAFAIAIRTGEQRQLKWMALILFSLGSSALCGIGRIEYGLSGALASRYFPFSALGIVGIYMAVLHSFEATKKTDKKGYALLYGAVLSTLLIGLINGYASGMLRGRETFEMKKGMADRLATYRHADDADLEYLFRDAEKLRRRAAILEELEYNVFRRRVDD